MSTVTFQQLPLAKGAIKSTWTITGTNDGAPEAAPQFPQKTFAVTGTFGGGTVILEESADAVTWVQSVNPQGTAVSFTAAGAMPVASNAKYHRPRASVSVTSVVAVLTSTSPQ